MVEEKKQDQEETPFNMAMLFYYNLNKLVEKKDEAYINNDLEAWFKGLNCIYNKIVFKLSDEEEELLNQLFAWAMYKIENRGKVNGYAPAFILHKIDFSLIKLMNKYKMIFPKIEVHRGVSRLRDKYKLGVDYEG